MKMKNRVLAVLALALLMINMVPVKMAEAADDYTGIIENMYDRYVENFGELSLDTHPYYVVIYNGTELYFVPSEWQGVVDFVNDSGPRFRKSDNSVFYATKYTFSTGQYGTYSGSRLNMNSLTQLNTGIIYANYAPVKSYDDEYQSGYLDKYYSVNCAPVPSVKYAYFGYEPEPDPLVLPVTQPGYEYWLYHKTTSGEYMYWSKDPFDLEVSEGKYLLNLSTGDIVYRLHLSSSHTYYRQILSGSMQYVISSGDVFRSSHELVFDDVTIEAWTEGDVTYVHEVDSAGYMDELPYVSAFTKYSSGGRSSFDGTKISYWNCSIKVEGTMPEEAAQKFFVVEGKYLMPTRAYFDMCREKDIEPDYLEWKDMYYKTAILKQANYDEYYTIVFYRDEIEFNERLICLETSNYVMEMKESGVLDDIYATNLLNVETFVYKPFLNKIKTFMTPLEVRVTAKCVVDMNVCYGKTFTTQMFHHIAPDLPDINAVIENYYDLTNRESVVKESLQGALQTQTSEYYQNLLADMQQKLNDAEVKISTLEQTLEVDDSGNLFGTFSSLANGISGLSGSFRNISTAVGNVFAFFPDEIITLLYGGFIALIVIAVYKALRG